MADQNNPASTIDKAALVAAVERYLAAKGFTVGGDTLSAAVAAALPAGKPHSCGCTAKPAPQPAQPPKPATIPAPKIEIVDFVCEADVRAAIAARKKIFIGPRTIVTPAARDAASEGEILVLAER